MMSRGRDVDRWPTKKWNLGLCYTSNPTNYKKLNFSESIPDHIFQPERSGWNQALRL
jgi:hypothetical protein